LFRAKGGNSGYRSRSGRPEGTLDPSPSCADLPVLSSNVHTPVDELTIKVNH
jgi:hypothetical protein